jgi:peptidoglycan/xylan/chitin deacetylase (PgdA/CDA1 family)
LGSVLLHAGAIAACLLRPDAWPWVLGVVIANHVLLAGAGLWPRSRLLGPNWVRLPQGAQTRGEIALTIDDGPDPIVTPQVLDLLQRHGAHVSFFCVGEKLARHPNLAREISERGHSVENHSQHHRAYFSLLGPQGMEREILAAQNLFTKITGKVPQFFRAPAGLRNPFLDFVLAKHDLRLASWTRRGFDTVNGNAARVLSILTRNLAAGDILLLHDGNAARTAAGSPLILEVLPPLLEAISRAGLHTVTLPQALK